MMSTLGVRVTLVEGRNEVLGFLDSEITEAFQYQMRRAGMTLRLGEKVDKIEQLPPENGHGGLVQATLESGKHLRARPCFTPWAGKERRWPCASTRLD